MRLHVIEAQQWHTVCDSTTEAMAFVIVGRADWWVGVGSGPDVTGGDIRRTCACNLFGRVIRIGRDFC